MNTSRHLCILRLYFKNTLWHFARFLVYESLAVEKVVQQWRTGIKLPIDRVILHYIMCSVANEIKGLWKEGVVAWIKELSRHLSEGLTKPYTSWCARSVDQDSKPRHSGHITNFLPNISWLFARSIVVLQYPALLHFYSFKGCGGGVWLRTPIVLRHTIIEVYCPVWGPRPVTSRLPPHSIIFLGIHLNL
jgi:hypothetical protein